MLGPLKQIVAQLECVVLDKEQQVSALLAERRRLRARAAAVQAVMDTCNALVALDGALARGTPGGYEREREAQMGELLLHLGTPGGQGGTEGGGGGGGSGGSGSDRDPSIADLGEAQLAVDLPVKLRWSVEDAVSKAGGCDTSPLAILEQLKQYAVKAGLLVSRVRDGSPDADVAGSKLEAMYKDLLEYSALAIFARPPKSMTHMVIYVNPINDDGDGDEGRRGPAPEPTEQHWMWAAQQMRLTQEQEDIIINILDMWRERCDAILARRQDAVQLLNRITSGGSGVPGQGGEPAPAPGAIEPLAPSLSGAYHDDPEAVAEEVQLLDIRQSTSISVSHMAVTSVITAEQHAAHVQASHPFFPALPALERGVRAMRAAREGAVQAADTVARG